MQLSVREVFRLSERCFSAVGFDEGPARANAEAIWWTEAYRGEGMTILHALLDTLPDLDRTALALRHSDASISVVDSDRQPAIVPSVPALDLACARAEREGTGVAYATVGENDVTMRTLGHMAYRAAERGCIGIVLAAGAQGHSETVIGMPDQPHPHFAQVSLEAPSASYTKLVGVIDEGLHARHDSPLAQAVFDTPAADAYRVAEHRMLNRLIDGAVRPAVAGHPDPDPGFIIACLQPRYPSYAGLEQVVDTMLADTDRFDTVFEPEQIQNRTDRLLHNGVEVEDAVWRDVFELSSEVLAPAFEGSHSGAGFDINK